jgi:hypothetical protein
MHISVFDLLTDRPESLDQFVLASIDFFTFTTSASELEPNFGMNLSLANASTNSKSNIGEM